MKVQASLNLNHVVMRVEQAGKEPGAGALSLKLGGTVKREQVAPIFSTDTSYAKILAPLWNPDGELATSDLDEIPLTTRIVGGLAVLETPFGEKCSFEKVKVDSVTVKPMPGFQCEISMRMAVYPDKDALWFIFVQQHKPLTVTCTPSQLSLDMGENEDDDRGSDRPVPQDGDLPLDDPNASEGEESPFAGMQIE